MDDPVKLWVLGIVALILAYIIRWVFAKLGKPLNLTVISIIVFAISGGLAWLWWPPQTPVCKPDDVPGCINQWLVLAFAVVGTATTVYNLLIKWILEKLGGTISQVLAKKLNTNRMARPQ
jgi:hypothetical protein